MTYPLSMMAASVVKNVATWILLSFRSRTLTAGES